MTAPVMGVKQQIRQPPSRATLEWVCTAVGSGARIDSWMVAPGGSACAIHAIDVLDSGGVRHPLILKRFFREDWLAREPDVAEREARHLTWLEGVDLPLPRLVAVDANAAVCDLPAILMTRLSGRAVLAPDDLDAWLRQIAAPLHVLHALPDEVARGFSPYRHYTEPDAVEVPRWSKRPDVWERVITRLQSAPPAAVDRFVHRDYHPCNLLWTQGQVSAVLDFTDSSYGPAAVDLGHCCINLTQLHGPDAADRFVEIHEEIAPGTIELDPYWDLVSLMNVLPGPRDVYWGWRNLGVAHLTPELCWERLDEFAARRVDEAG